MTSQNHSIATGSFCNGIFWGTSDLPGSWRRPDRFFVVIFNVWTFVTIAHGVRWMDSARVMN